MLGIWAPLPQQSSATALMAPFKEKVFQLRPLKQATEPGMVVWSASLIPRKLSDVPRLLHWKSLLQGRWWTSPEPSCVWWQKREITRHESVSELGNSLSNLWRGQTAVTPCLGERKKRKQNWQNWQNTQCPRVSALSFWEECDLQVFSREWLDWCLLRKLNWQTAKEGEIMGFQPSLTGLSSKQSIALNTNSSALQRQCNWGNYRQSF